MFGRKWEPITGRVVESAVYKIYGGGDKKPRTETRWKYVVEYQDDGGEPQRVELKQEWGWLTKRMINVSGSVPLLLDRRSGKVRFDWKNPEINWKAHLEQSERKSESDFERALKG
jgi:hypothetical protein